MKYGRLRGCISVLLFGLLPVFWATGPVDAAGEIATVAGGGTGSLGGISEPSGIAVGLLGDLYIADTGGHRVYRLDSASGSVAVVAGNGTASLIGASGLSTEMGLNGPAGVFSDVEGNVYIADRENHRILRADPVSGVVEAIAGSGSGGYSGDGGTATWARLNRPSAVFVDGLGNVFIADTDNNRVRKIDATTGVITTVAGNGRIGASFGSYAGDGGEASLAVLNVPQGVFVDRAGHIYIADTGNNRVRKVDAVTGKIETIAGIGTAGFSGDNGPATDAMLNRPSGVFRDTAGDLYIADANNNRLRLVDGSGTIVTVAGNGSAGFSGDGGSAMAAQLDRPVGVFMGGAGHLYVCDSGNDRVRRISYLGSPTVLTPGTYRPPSITAPRVITSWPVNQAVNIDPEFIQANGVSLLFSEVVILDDVRIEVRGGATRLDWEVEWAEGNTRLTLMPSGRPDFDTQYRVLLNGIADNEGNIASEIVVQFTTKSLVSEVLAGNIETIVGLLGPGFAGDGGFASEMQMISPADIFVDGDGNLYIADTGNNRIRKVDGKTGFVSTVAGTGEPGSLSKRAASRLPAIVVKLDRPSAVFVDGDGSIYISDEGNHQVQKVDNLGLLTAVAGNGMGGYSGDGGAATEASLNGPSDIFVDAAGNLYISDRRNGRIRKVDDKGVMTTVAGNGMLGYSGDQGPATNAGLQDVRGLAVDAEGNLYFADGNRVRMVDAATGIITTVAGGVPSSCPLGDGGPATEARLSPEDVAIDGAGDLLISDVGRVRKVEIATGVIMTVAGTGRMQGFVGDGGPATDAVLSAAGIHLDPVTGNLYIADRFNHRIRKVDQVSTPLDQLVSPGDPGDPVVQPPTPPDSGGGKALQADFNGDGEVSFSDFLDLVLSFGSQQGDRNYQAQIDLNNDGNIGFADFVIFATSYGQSA